MDERVELALKGSEFKRVMESHLDAIKKQYDFKKVDIEVLFYLSGRRDSNTPTDIYRRLGLNRGHVSQAIDTLVKRGYIFALPDKDDRRSMHYVITEKADKVISQIRAMKNEFEQRLLEGISEEEKETFKRVTYKLMENLEKM